MIRAFQLLVCIISFGAQIGLAKQTTQDSPLQEATLWETARQRGAVYEDCGRNAQRLLAGWLEQKQDPATHLFSRGRVWDYHNEAADHYSSLVVIANYVQPELNQPGGALYQTMIRCRDLCLTDNGLPALYDLKTMTRGKTASLDRLSEWLRDGLVRVAEFTGKDNIWYEEFLRLTDAMLAEAERRGGVAKTFTKPEFVGHMLQSLARLYAMSGQRRYLLAAQQLADAQLADPKSALDKVTLVDHGGELAPGLGEFLALEGQLNRPKTQQHAAAMRVLLDGVLEKYAHPETGLLCYRKTDDEGNVTWSRPPNAWAYIHFTFENYDRATGENRYRRAVEKPLIWLTENFDRSEEVKPLWPINRASDDYSDTYESIQTLMIRYPSVDGMVPLLDWLTLQHIHRRQGDKKYGPYTGGHFDGSTGRTLCLHMMLNSQGVRTAPFVEGLCLGGVIHNDVLYLSLENKSPSVWSGRLRFDWPRNEHRAARIDWSRINEMPQWFTVRHEKAYTVRVDDQPAGEFLGATLIDGLPVELKSGAVRRMSVQVSQ